MPRYNLQEPLQTLAAVLDNVVAEPVGEYLPRERGDRHARALALQDVAEVLEVRVAAPHDRVLEFEGWDVGAADYLVRGVHVSGCAVCLGVADLLGLVSLASSRWLWLWWRWWFSVVWCGVGLGWVLALLVAEGLVGGYELRGSWRGPSKMRPTHLDLEEVLRWPVDLLEGLLA